MEFNEKLQKLRNSKNITQEELADKLYVSRTAVSKWESGKGYPCIDSLKSIADFFGVSVDELLSGEEIVTIAKADKKASESKYVSMICGILDCFIILLFLLPFFGEENADNIRSVTLLSLEKGSVWLKAIFIIVSSFSVLNGFSSVVISSLDKPLWNKHRIITGTALSAIGTVVFILAGVMG